MRSVNPERKNRGQVRATRAAPARGKRELPAVQPGSARKSGKKGILARISGRFSILVHRPIVALCAGLTVLVLIGALFASGVIGRTVRGVNRGIDAVVADAGFGIAEIHITGNRRTPYNQVLEVLGMQPGQSIFSADLNGAQRRLSHLDWIASAEVHRRYPDAIFVTLVEKRPFALWQLPPDAHGNAPIAVVERSGAVITSRDVDKFRRLPKLVGAGAGPAAAELVDAVQAHRAVAARIAAYARVSMRRWNLILDDGVVVKLPEADWPKQLDALEHLIIDAGILERDVSEIDLRSPTHYFFVLKSGEKKDVERGKET
ncbi:MAG TPA: FtsQ-type POTRA domain-containing protein [Rhizomicrobium sp.]|jgi:cell division protein FtsQ|nr:FtsQ-type POTRA domain-containing protein [Rhizomicrobium sp.]